MKNGKQVKKFWNKVANCEKVEKLWKSQIILKYQTYVGKSGNCEKVEKCWKTVKKVKEGEKVAKSESVEKVKISKK